MHPSEYVRHRRAEGMTDGEIIGRQMEVLEQEAQAFAILTDELKHRIESSKQKMAQERIKLDNRTAFRRAILGQIAREGRCFAPKVKTAHYGAGDMIVRDKREGPIVLNTDAFQALLPEATEWNESVAITRLCRVVNEGCFAKITSGDDSEGVLAMRGENGEVEYLVSVATGEECEGKVIPTDVVGLRSASRTYTAKVCDVPFELPDWSGQDWPEEPPGEEKEDADV